MCSCGKEVARGKGWKRKQCYSCMYKKFKKSNPDYWRKYLLRDKFVITLEDYEVMLAEQNSVCAICGGKDNKKLAVDHDHKTGKVRGLLCVNCNHLLGRAKDELHILQQAINYLIEKGNEK